MIRLLRRLGRFPAGTETDFFDAAAEAAFLLDGTAEPIGPGATGAEGAHAAASPARKTPEAAEPAPDAPGWAAMKKDELLRAALERGLDVSPRAKVAEIVAALEASDADA